MNYIFGLILVNFYLVVGSHEFGNGESNFVQIIIYKILWFGKWYIMTSFDKCIIYSDINQKFQHMSILCRRTINAVIDKNLTVQ